MVFKCNLCTGEFETPQALGAHKALKCNRGSSALPALVRKSGGEGEKKRKAPESPGPSSSQQGVRSVPSAAHDPVHVSSLQQERKQEASLSGGNLAAGEKLLEVDLADPSHEIKRGECSALPPIAAQPADGFSPPDLESDAFAQLPDSSEFEYVQPLTSEYKPTVDFVRWVRSCNNNAGLPKSDVDGLFELFRKGVRPEQLKVRNSKDVQSFEADHLFLEKDGWRKHVLTRPGDPYEVVLFYKDSGLALRRLLSRSNNAPGFAHQPETKYDRASGRRRVSTPETAFWWEEAQRYINSGFCLDAIIAALILYSDATSLSNDRRTSGWPLVLTLANILMELRGRPDGHELLAVFPILRAVPGCPGFEPDSPELRLRIKETFHECLGIVLQPLKDWSFSGIVTSGPSGVEETFYPLLFSYICDHPEGCKVTCTKDGNRTLRPCSVCMVRASELNDVSKKHEYRSPADAEGLLAQLEAGTNEERDEALQALEQKSLHPIKSGLTGFNGGRTKWGNWYKAVHVDCMHQSDIGVFPTVMDAVLAAAAGSSSTRLARSIESHLMKIRETCRFADLRIPGSDKGGYFTSKSRSKFTAFEQRAVMQVIVFALIGLVGPKYVYSVVGFLEWYIAACRSDSFTREELDRIDDMGIQMVARLVRVLGSFQTSEFGIVKVHAISHYPDCIWRSGIPQQYSANLYESLHIQLLKNGYRGSNRRDAMEQVVRHHRRLCALRELAGFDLIDEAVDEFPELPNRESALQKAVRSGMNELAGEKGSLRLDWLYNISLTPAPPFGIVSKFATDLFDEQNEVRFLYNELRAFLGADFAHVKGSKVNVHTALAVPPGVDARSAKRAMYARATSSFFGLPWFSNVVIKAEAAGQPPLDWYAEVRLLFSCTISKPGARDELREMALVRYYQEQAGVDPVTKCKRLRWEQPKRLFRVVSVHNVLRLVHIVPNFSSREREEFFINRFLFEH